MTMLENNQFTRPTAASCYVLSIQWNINWWSVCKAWTTAVGPGYMPLDPRDATDETLSHSPSSPLQCPSLTLPSPQELLGGWRSPSPVQYLHWGRKGGRRKGERERKEQKEDKWLSSSSKGRSVMRPSVMELPSLLSSLPWVNQLYSTLPCNHVINIGGC